MKKSFYLQIFVFAIIVAFMGSFNTYAQDEPAVKLPEFNTQKVFTQWWKSEGNNNFGDALANLAFGYGNFPSGLMHDITLPGGILGNMPAWAAPGFPTSMTRDPSLTPNSYWIVDDVDSVWQFDQNTGLVTYWGILTGGPVGAYGMAYNPADGMFYLVSGDGAIGGTNSDLWVMSPPPPTPGPMPVTYVGPCNTGSGWMSGMCFDDIGTCYGYDLSTDMAYTINTTTGNATVLGSLGFGTNFTGGLTYDYERGWIYLSAIEPAAGNEGQLRVMDPQTGWTTRLAGFGVWQMAPFAAQTDPNLTLPGPGRALTPLPFNGDPNVVIISTPALSWINPPGCTGNTVYFGTDFNTAGIIYSGGPVTTVPMPPLSFYYCCESWTLKALNIKRINAFA